VKDGTAGRRQRPPAGRWPRPRPAGWRKSSDIGRRVGRSRVAVSNLLRLLDLPDEVLGLLEAGELTEGHGRALLLAEDHADRRRLAREAMAGSWSVRELEARARSRLSAVRQDLTCRVFRKADG